MRIIRESLNYIEGLFSKKSSIEVNVHKLSDILNSPSHIEKINCKSEIELIKLLKDISKNKFNSTFIAQDLAKILNVNNQSISVKGLINLLKREYNRKAIFNLLRIDNEYITTEEGFKRLILRNIKQSPEVIEDLLSNAETSKLLFKRINSEYLLDHAIKHGEDKIVELLIEKGAPVNMLTLYYCIRNGKFEIFNFLMEMIEDKTLIDKEYHRLFDYAIKYKRCDIVHMIFDELLINKKYRDFLDCIIKYERYYIIDKILRNTNINLVDSKGQTLLHHAVKLGNLKIVEKLISKGAQLNCVDQNGCTPLNLAIKSRNTDITNLLLNVGADIRYTYSPSEGNIIQVYTKEDYKFFIPLLNTRNDPWVMQKDPGTTLQQVRNANLIQMISSV